VDEDTNIKKICKNINRIIISFIPKYLTIVLVLGTFSNNAGPTPPTPKEGDLVVLHIPLQEGENKNPKGTRKPAVKPVFGYVMSNRKGRSNAFKQIHSKLGEFH
jgi:hypothetical protein